MALLPEIYNDLVKNFNYFSISSHLDVDTYKRFSELVIFFELTSDHCKIENEESNSSLKKLIISEFENLTENRVFRNLYTAYHIISPYASIRKYRKFDTLKKALNLVVQYKLFPPETPPHRAMEWDYLLYKLDSNHIVPIPKSSILNQDFQPQFFDREIAYTLTHALFYLTDFGFSDRKPPIKNLKKIKFQLEILMAKFHENDDIDVLLELAINYFSLFPFLQLDYNVLNIINHALMKTSFVEFNWNKEQLEKKYHSFLVLGILTVLLKSHIVSSKIGTAKRKQLSLQIQDTLFESSINFSSPGHHEDYIKSTAIIQSWEFLRKIKYKDFDADQYKKYTKKFDNNAYLTESLLSYLMFLKERNELDILWTREFEELNVPDSDQKKLKDDYQNKTERDIAYLHSLS